MLGLGLLLGHMVGDYLLQNDWIAAKKTKYSLPCVIHCLLYTAGVFSVCYHFQLPWEFYLAVAVLHFPVDRFGLPRRLMLWVGNENFVAPPFAPWSVIIVDNALHLLVLFWAAMICKHYDEFSFVNFGLSCSAVTAAFLFFRFSRHQVR